ncbi:MAG: hypothetical protein Fur0023_10730 [Bacteroidia bacterium]
MHVNEKLLLVIIRYEHPQRCHFTSGRQSRRKKSFYVLKPTTWADDELTTLQKPDIKKIEQFILENKHLPGVPSQAEIQKEGYNVHEMNTILLRKIEELYKIVIAQQKEIEELKK